jgi:transcriptional regulator with XRE-family HTH domain
MAAGLTQEELAAQAGVSARTISDIERGLTRRSHHDTMALLAEALGLSGAAGAPAPPRARLASCTG